MNNNTLTGYCFLASLTENQNDLYNHVYIPICKRALSKFSIHGDYGSAEDIQEIINEDYGIQVPIIIIRKLIRAVESVLSRKLKEKINFQVLANGNNFRISIYAFTELEENYKKGKRNASALQKAFEEYIKQEVIEHTDIAPFSDFLDKNKNRLSAFFATGQHINGDFSDSIFIYHVQFLEYIEMHNHLLYKIAENIYLGSIVAGFLEAGFEMDSKFISNEIYYIDTPIILRALDIQKEEDTKPVLELLDLIKNTGGSVKILSITLDEVYSIIEKAIGSYDNTNPTSTINEACLRLGKNKTWLINLNAKLEEKLKNLDIELVPFSIVYKEKFSKSQDIKDLKESRLRKGTAEHDVFAYLYVRERREGVISTFQKAKEWFLTSNKELVNFNIDKAGSKKVSEVILPDGLTSLLWLKNPHHLANKVKSVGLSELMAITLDEEIASKELIIEFNNNLKQLDGLSTDEYRILLESVAHQSAKNIERLNNSILEDKTEAKKEALIIIEKERKRKRQVQEKIKEVQALENNLVQEKEKLDQKLKDIEVELNEAKKIQESTKTELENLADTVLEIRKHGKKYKKIGLIGLISFVFFILIIIYRHRLDKFFTVISGILTTSGWVWGLGSFAINAYKLSKGK
ncbi:hypothetical protein AM493_16160 [Flavobacterium akiainvivens]|uniref:Uncharacterized protein n=1 Tax=Flavobacterium akiainvivens TaxID=1202724 RepID=A0A0M8MET7_9FLAO|nr:hypothetical protein [Flavobacterium akiainvivens]KOS07404.1 hypothetical protein AM493_16160 [Flavobacterium akiainvivens]SFQ47733.1 hypothetical protein SAMN05444144_105213 [Flavobacterium akiainvivens]